ncbi:hypothetical protein [Pseudomonas sp. 18173]|uniref:hypothetical protein n=1 Tax=Pseudomonas sp. 18173 TaxID=3390055 RepID=UPI003D25B58E
MNLTSTQAITCSNKAVEADPFTGALCASDHQECCLYRLSNATIGRYELGQGLGYIHYTGASVGVVAVIPGSMTVDEATKLADREMYKVKQQRNRQRL